MSYTHHRWRGENLGSVAPARADRQQRRELLRASEAFCRVVRGELRSLSASSVYLRGPLQRRLLRVCPRRPRPLRHRSASGVSAATSSGLSPRPYPRSLDARRVRSRHAASLARQLRQLAIGHVDGRGVDVARTAAPSRSYINLSARWIKSAASLRATPRRSATGPSRRHTTPTSTFTGSRRQPPIFPRPVVAFHGGFEALGDLHRLGASGQIGNQETEFVAAEARVQVARFAAGSTREEVLRSDLIGEDPRDALDDPIADRVAERVVVPLEAGDVDDADRAPADALLDRQKRLDALHEPVEVQELRLGIAMGFLGEIGDDFLEVARDVADGDVLLADLPLQSIHLAGEAFGERADGVVLRFLDQLPLPADDLFDCLQQLRLAAPASRSSVVLDPVAQVGRRTRTFPRRGSSPPSSRGSLAMATRVMY